MDHPSSPHSCSAISYSRDTPHSLATRPRRAAKTSLSCRRPALPCAPSATLQPARESHPSILVFGYPLSAIDIPATHAGLSTMATPVSFAAAQAYHCPHRPNTTLRLFFVVSSPSAVLTTYIDFFVVLAIVWLCNLVTDKNLHRVRHTGATTHGNGGLHSWPMGPERALVLRAHVVLAGNAG
ncbi:hypothetical protein C8F01DRAFT_640252 [Mycena amicta]|nr:hypothetical protein C8F01DRAFT_640252 [Mycena amicta]